MLEACLKAFVEAGTLDLSLDQLAARVGTSKRMLIHYFHARDGVELMVMRRLEDTLRAQFSPESFPGAASLRALILAIWAKATTAQARGILLLVMDLSRRAWTGSAAARAFYDHQIRQWARLLLSFSGDKALIEAIIVTFQGAILTLLSTGDAQPGRRALLRLLPRRGGARLAKTVR